MTEEGGGRAWLAVVPRRRIGRSVYLQLQDRKSFGRRNRLAIVARRIKSEEGFSYRRRIRASFLYNAGSFSRRYYGPPNIRFSSPNI